MIFWPDSVYSDNRLTWKKKVCSNKFKLHNYQSNPGDFNMTDFFCYLSFKLRTEGSSWPRRGSYAHPGIPRTHLSSQEILDPLNSGKKHDIFWRQDMFRNPPTPG